MLVYRIMPSQAAHFIFALEALKKFKPELTENSGVAGPADGPTLRALALGAQAPDMFYHNRIRRPSGLKISVALHRRGFSTVAADMLAASAGEGLIFALAFLSHAVLDRQLHPWINYRCGWEVPGLPESQAFRYQHAFCERLVDVYFAGRTGMTWVLGPAFSGLYGPADFPESDSRSSFQETLNSFGYPAPYRALLLGALRSCYANFAEDEFLEERIDNAYRDSFSYYSWASNLDGKSYEEERKSSFDSYRKFRKSLENPGSEEKLSDSEERDFKGGALVHPRIDLGDRSYRELYRKLTNPDKEAWTDPCARSVPHSESLDELWNSAQENFFELCEKILELKEKGVVEPDRVRAVLGKTLHDGDLRSTASDGDCALELCSPVDWYKLCLEREIGNLEGKNAG